VREALFSSVTSLLGNLDGLDVLDLYAGSGALGLEALSRGARHCIFVEHDKRALRTLRSNVQATGLVEAEIRAGEVGRVLSAGAPRGADLVMVDPPYAMSAVELTARLDAMVVHGWLAEDGVVVVERPAREPEPTWPGPLRVLQRRRYGDTLLWYLREADDHDRRSA
jgi:16S rRNA (guanine966-N2)-methyltransferase